MAKVRETTLEEFKQDPGNANAGTPEGKEMLARSFKEAKAGRSLLADAEGILIAGNKSQQAAIEAGLLKVVVVETDGEEVVVVQRTDLKPGDPEREALALYDNRTGQLNLRWDPQAIKEKAKKGLDISRFGWNPDAFKEKFDALRAEAVTRREEYADPEAEEEYEEEAEEAAEPTEGTGLGRDDMTYHFQFDLTFDQSILVDRALKEWEIQTGKSREAWLIDVAGKYLRGDEIGEEQA